MQKQPIWILLQVYYPCSNLLIYCDVQGAPGIVEKAPLGKRDALGQASATRDGRIKLGPCSEPQQGCAGQVGLCRLVLEACGFIRARQQAKCQLLSSSCLLPEQNAF